MSLQLFVSLKSFPNKKFANNHKRLFSLSHAELYENRSEKMLCERLWCVDVRTPKYLPMFHRVLHLSAVICPIWPKACPAWATDLPLSHPSSMSHPKLPWGKAVEPSMCLRQMKVTSVSSLQAFSPLPGSRKVRPSAF